MEELKIKNSVRENIERTKKYVLDFKVKPRFLDEKQGKVVR